MPTRLFPPFLLPVPFFRLLPRSTVLLRWRDLTLAGRAELLEWRLLFFRED